MRRTDAAEWFLSLTTSRDHAAAIAGDLAQQAPQLGTRWFWTSLLRAAASLTWRGFADAPLRMSGLGLVGLLLLIIYAVLFMIPITLAHFAIAVARFQAPPGTPPGTGEVGFAVAGLSSVWESAVAFMIATFFLGKWLARRAPQRELVVYAVIFFVAHVLWIPINIAFPVGEQVLPTPFDVAMDVVGTVVGLLFFFAGVRRQRRKMTLA